MGLIAKRSKASNQGSTTERGVVLYGSPSSSWYIYIYISEHNLLFLFYTNCRLNSSNAKLRSNHIFAKQSN